MHFSAGAGVPRVSKRGNTCQKSPPHLVSRRRLSPMTQEAAAQVAEPAEKPKRRRRRTKAEMEAARAARGRGKAKAQKARRGRRRSCGRRCHREAQAHARSQDQGQGRTMPPRARWSFRLPSSRACGGRRRRCRREAQAPPRPSAQGGRRGCGPAAETAAAEAQGSAVPSNGAASEAPATESDVRPGRGRQHAVPARPRLTMGERLPPRTSRP